MGSITQKKVLDFSFLITLLGLLTCIFISYPLWFGMNTIFSPSPIFSSFESLPNFINPFLSIALIIVSTSAYFLRHYRRKLLCAYALIMIVALLVDQLKWQPWVYYYSFILMSFLFIQDHKTKDRIRLIQLILAFIYVWSGIQKLNHNFFFVTYPWIIEPLTNLQSEDISELFNHTFFIAPLVEFFAGLGLFFRKTRRYSAIILILMHGFILTMIGPLGHNSNSVVWPWNISFSILLYLLFIKRNIESESKIDTNRVPIYTAIVIILMGIMPIFSFLSMWPMFFSSALYSGNKVRSEVYISDAFKEQSSDFIKSNVNEFENVTRLSFFVEDELNVPIYPSINFHLSTFKKMCLNYPEYSFDFILVTNSRPNILSGEKTETTYFCDEIE